MALSLAAVFAVSACVPLPIPQGTHYYPNSADLTFSDQGSFNVCGYDPGTGSQGFRDFGSVRVTAWLRAPNDRPAARGITSASLDFTVQERSEEASVEPFTMNPSLVRLEEAGRSYPVESFSASDPRRETYGSSQSFTLRFPEGTGVDDDLRIVFEAGAISRAGQPLALQQIRYERRPLISVYMFPCIPS